MKWFFIVLVVLNTQLATSNSFNKSIKRLNKSDKIVLTNTIDYAIIKE